MKKNILAISIAWVVLALVIGAVIVAVPTKKSTPVTKTKILELRSSAPTGSSKSGIPAAKNTAPNSVNTKLTILGPQYGGVIPPKLSVGQSDTGKVTAAIKIK